MRTLLFIGVLALVFGGIVYSHKLADTYGYASPSVSASSGPDDFDACMMAERFVKRRLKSPATADFPPCHEATIFERYNGTFVVKSHVDSENSFGANVRTHYHVLMSHNSDGTWNLETFETLD